MSSQIQPKSGSSLAGPAIVPAFVEELDRLVGLARRGHKPDAAFNNPVSYTHLTLPTILLV